MSIKINYKNGGISILVLVLGITAAVAIGGLAVTAATVLNSSLRNESFEKALYIAQSGIDYYKWHLSHDSNDLTDGTGHAGPYVHDISDPLGNTAGSFKLTITPSSTGSSILTIVSEGWTNDRPDVKRRVTVKYGKPSIAKFSFANNANMWFGKHTEIHGPVFSNGGIRMDADHDSTVESAKSTYTCGTETGCDPPEEKPGIWGSGGPQSLWSFPVNSIDFNTISLDYVAMKQEAQNNGVYLLPSGAFGYHIIFAANGSYNVYRVSNVRTEDGWNVEDGCVTLNEIIRTEQFVGTYQTSEKQLVFAEDNLYINGVVNGNITVVAAKFPLDINKMNIWIYNNLTYTAKDGSSRLGIVAQNDILFPQDLPQIFEINAAMYAQKGRVLRNSYKVQHCVNGPGAVRQQLVIYGSIVSNMKSYWTYGQGELEGPTSGFSHPDIIYDSSLLYNPPPYFPTTGTIELISWEEN